MPYERLWHGVVAAASPGVAAQDAAQGQPTALQRAVFLQRLDGVGRTGGREAATGGKEGGNEPPVEKDGEQE